MEKYVGFLLSLLITISNIFGAGGSDSLTIRGGAKLERTYINSATPNTIPYINADKQIVSIDKPPVSGYLLSMDIDGGWAWVPSFIHHTQSASTPTFTGATVLESMTISTEGHVTATTSRAMTKNDLGLGNVDNTSDANKPVSTATQTALTGKAASTHNHGTGTANRLTKFTNTSGSIGNSIVSDDGTSITIGPYNRFYNSSSTQEVNFSGQGTHHYTNVGLARFNNSTTGIIKITVPNNYSASSAKMVISLDDAYGVAQLDLKIQISAGVMTDCDYTRSGTFPSNLVRYCYDGTNACILLGILTTNWVSVCVSIKDVYETYPLSYSAGMPIALITSETGLTNINTGTEISIKEPFLGTPSSNGMLLASNTDNTRTWVSGTTPAAHGLVSATHTVSGLTAGDVLKATSATTFGFATPGYEPTLPTAASSGLILTSTAGNGRSWASASAPGAHGLVSSTHTVSGLTTGQFLKALSGSTYGFAPHGLTYTDVGAAASGHDHLGTYESALGNPPDWGMVLSSTPAGTRSWISASSPAAHDLVSSTHTASGLTTGYFLKATGSNTYAFGPHGLTYTDVGAASSGHNHSGVYEPLLGSSTVYTYLRGDKTWQTLNTGNIPEYSSLYFTNARAQAAITGAASTVTTSNLPANMVLGSNASGKIASTGIPTSSLISGSGLGVNYLLKWNGSAAVSSTIIDYGAGSGVSVENHLSVSGQIMTSGVTIRNDQITATGAIEAGGLVSNGNADISGSVTVNGNIDANKFNIKKMNIGETIRVDAGSINTPTVTNISNASNWWFDIISTGANDYVVFIGASIGDVIHVRGGNTSFHFRSYHSTPSPQGPVYLCYPQATNSFVCAYYTAQGYPVWERFGRD